MSFLAADSFIEEDGTGEVVVVLTTVRDISAPITVPVKVVSGGTATEDDFMLVGNTVTFPAGSGNGDEQEISIALEGDLLVEGEETLVLALEPASGALLGAEATHTATILDSDRAILTFDTLDTPELDGQSVFNFTVAATGPGGEDAVLVRDYQLTISDLETGTATLGADYLPVTAKTFEYPAGGPGGVGSIVISVRSDREPEGDETIALQLQSSLDTDSVEINIRDDDGLVVADRANGFVFLGTDSATSHASKRGLRGMEEPQGMTYDPVRKLVYIADTEVGLFSYQTETKELAYIGEFGIANVQIEGLAFDSNSNILYGVDDRANSNSLVTINTDTGRATVVGAGGLLPRGTEGLAFDSNTNTLYGSNDGGNFLIAINTVTGQPSTVGGEGATYGPDGSVIESLAFDAKNNILYGINGSGDGSIVTIDTATGVATLVAALTEPLDDLRGLTFDPATDELLAVASRRLLSLFRLNPLTAEHRFEKAVGIILNGLAHDTTAQVTYGLSAGGALFSIDVATGKESQIGFVGRGFQALAVDPAGPTLYGANGLEFYRIGVADAATTLLGTFLEGETPVSMSGLAFDTRSNTLFGITNGGQLYSVATADGVSSAVGGPSDVGTFVGLGYDPINNVLYAVTPSELVSINPGTGVATLVGPTGGSGMGGVTFDTRTASLLSSSNSLGTLVEVLPGNARMSTLGALGATGVASLAWDPGDKILYSYSLTSQFLVAHNFGEQRSVSVMDIGEVGGQMGFDSIRNVLYGIFNQNFFSIDIKTGSMMSLGSADFVSMAFDANTDTMYGIDNISLYTVDLATGAGTKVGDFDELGPRYLAFDKAKGILYGIDNDAQSLMTIDTSTGKETLLRTIGQRDILGMTFLN